MFSFVKVEIFNLNLFWWGEAVDDTPYLCNCTSEHSPQSKCDVIWHNSTAPYFKWDKDENFKLPGANKKKIGET